jgi:hypothetical protein
VSGRTRTCTTPCADVDGARCGYNAARAGSLATISGRSQCDEASSSPRAGRRPRGGERGQSARPYRSRTAVRCILRIGGRYRIAEPRSRSRDHLGKRAARNFDRHPSCGTQRFLPHGPNERYPFAPPCPIGRSAVTGVEVSGRTKDRSRGRKRSSGATRVDLVFRIRSVPSRSKPKISRRKSALRVPSRLFVSVLIISFSTRYFRCCNGGPSQNLAPLTCPRRPRGFR